jgi:hypothetical protein
MHPCLSRGAQPNKASKGRRPKLPAIPKTFKHPDATVPAGQTNDSGSQLDHRVEEVTGTWARQIDRALRAMRSTYWP